MTVTQEQLASRRSWMSRPKSERNRIMQYRKEKSALNKKERELRVTKPISGPRPIGVRPEHTNISSSTIAGRKVNNKRLSMGETIHVSVYYPDGTDLRRYADALSPKNINKPPSRNTLYRVIVKPK